MQKPSQDTVYGVGQGFVDLHAQTSAADLAALNIRSGSSILIDQSTHDLILTQLSGKASALSMNPGGSVANSLATVASLGGRATFSARIGDDPAGAMLCHDFATVGVQLGTPLIIGGTTGKVIVLTTPEGERTMMAHLGASADFSSADLSIPLLRRAHTIFLEGYLMGAGPVAQAALTEAARRGQQQGSLVATSLGSRELVQARRKEFLELLPHLSLVFGNEDEAMALTGKDSPHDAIAELGRSVPLAVVTCGGSGAFVIEQGKIDHTPPYPTHVIDTTGAGDAFAGGFLYGILNQHGALRAAAFGNFLASKAVAQAGARLGTSAWDAFREQFRGA